MTELPHSDDAERGVLSCCIQDPKCVGDCIERIGDEPFFYDLRRERIYKLFVEMFQAGKMDFLLIRNKLKEAGLLDGIGGDAGLSKLQDYSPSTANLSTYLDILEEKATHRKLIHTCESALEKARKADKVESVLNEAERDILRVRPARRVSKSVAAVTREALDELERLFALNGAIGGYTTGLSDLDAKTDGLHKGELIILAAFPSCGKSGLAMNIAEANYLQGRGVGVMSAEMRPSKLVQRAICALSRINSMDVKNGKMNEQDFAKMGNAAAKISKSPLYIENASGLSIQQVHAIARRLKQQHDIQLLIVDYLQLLSCKADSREQEISGVSKGLKGIAMELDIPVLALSQLNDDGKLRESRAIGQDADSVWKLENDGEWVYDNQPIKLIVEKNREGETGIVPLMFRKTITRFENAAKIADEDVPRK